MRSSLKSLYDLGSAFGISESAERPSSSSGLSSIRALPNHLKLGSIIFFHPSSAIDNYRYPDEVRRAFVSGLWRDDQGDLKKVEVMQLTTSFLDSKTYRSNLLIDTPSMQKKFHANKQAILVTNSICILNNDLETIPRRNFMETRNLPWRDILVRRAHAILKDKDHQLRIMGSLDGLEREGFTFKNILPEHVRHHTWQPDVPDGRTKRKEPDLLSQNEINQISRYAESFLESQEGKLRQSFGAATYPPSQEWDFHINPVAFKSYVPYGGGMHAPKVVHEVRL